MINPAETVDNKIIKELQNKKSIPPTKQRLILLMIKKWNEKAFDQTWKHALHMKAQNYEYDNQCTVEINLNIDITLRTLGLP